MSNETVFYTSPGTYIYFLISAEYMPGSGIAESSVTFHLW